MKHMYQVPKRLRKSSKGIIAKANEILAEYAAQGIETLTLRQLYYQFVARGYLPNQFKSYKKLGRTIGDGRLMGRVSWDAIEDRTRGLKVLTHFTNPQEALDRLAGWYAVDLWKDQAYRPEVWVEKDALLGVIAPVCQENDVPYFSCRGYTSLSSMWQASERLKGWKASGQTPYIIHLGDHDPSGMDMSRDIFNRLQKVFHADFQFTRVALNMDQVREYDPPPNWAKVTDSRYKAYVEAYGEESWELDALDPAKFRDLIESSVAGLRDKKKWAKAKKEQEAARGQLLAVGREWEQIGPQRKLLEEINQALRDEGLGQGELDDGLSECLKERLSALHGRITELDSALEKALQNGHRKKKKRGS